MVAAGDTLGREDGFAARVYFGVHDDWPKYWVYGNGAARARTVLPIGAGVGAGAAEADNLSTLGAAIAKRRIFAGAAVVFDLHEEESGRANDVSGREADVSLARGELCAGSGRGY
jgi:hypothetical protein